MRTTMIVDDRLLKRAKKEAASRGVTLSALIEEALRAALARDKPRPPPRFEMLTYGRGGPQKRNEPADFQRLLTAEDADRLGR